MTKEQADAQEYFQWLDETRTSDYVTGIYIEPGPHRVVVVRVELMSGLELSAESTSLAKAISDVADQFEDYMGEKSAEQYHNEY